MNLTIRSATASVLLLIMSWIPPNPGQCGTVGWKSKIRSLARGGAVMVVGVLCITWA